MNLVFLSVCNIRYLVKSLCHLLVVVNVYIMKGQRMIIIIIIMTQDHVKDSAQTTLADQSKKNICIKCIKCIKQN